jgi:hypothetical protein
MNLIPFALTIVAFVIGIIIADFEIGLLLGLIVGLVALQRETHLKIVSLQEELRQLSETQVKTPTEPATDSETDTNYTDSFESQPSYTRTASIPAQPERALQFDQPSQSDQPPPVTDPPQTRTENLPDGPFDSF